MILRYDGIFNPKGLEKELCIKERRRILYYDNYIEVELFDVIRQVETITNEDTGEVESEVALYYTLVSNGFDDDGVELPRVAVLYNLDVAKINAIISNHDPKRVYREDNSELLAEIILRSQTLEEMQNAIVTDLYGKELR